ncbi:MAG TPA: hypothetical protein VJT73_18180 [Polyangiaceae bacterium]|nr:hypothetical protein [Polyangiaceae bacterium]
MGSLSLPKRAEAVDSALFLLFAAGMTLLVARAFYGYMLVQTGGEWSAPLDDVFIHFDYARAAARGYPFQWSAGNGYSSGNTSLLYPFVLALGYLGGFRGSSLMIWAGLVACVSVFALLLVLRRLFDGLPPRVKYFAPLALFSVGALDWSLFSGMEVALYLGIWGGALGAALDLEEDLARPDGTRGVAFATSGWVLGLWGVLLVLTRPEGASSIAALGLMVAATAYQQKNTRRALCILAQCGAPAFAALVGQALANRLLTGEFAASGAIVKLNLYNPYMTPREKLDEYTFLLKYVVFRNTEYHFSDSMPYGYIVPALAAVPLLSERTRKIAITLWGSVASWLLIVALNAQVRWQNERYTMPAVAWLLVLAALGIALLVDPTIALVSAVTTQRAFVHARRALACVLVALFVVHQEPRLRDQIWFFGRASRNIRDQHITAGRMLRQMNPRPQRLLVGDAGALLYASDLPGVDLIGLGGFRDLPFARAGINGLGATLELLERVPAPDRPDVLAIYPSWWGDLPSWFGRYLAEVPVRGNVICGGSEKVIYRADWHALGRGETPVTLRPGEEIADELDIADLVSEGEHAYQFPHPSAGFVEMKVLPDPSDPRSELFDAGRRIPSGRSEHFRLKLVPGKSARIVVRTAPERPTRVRVAIDGEAIGALEFVAAEGWREGSIGIARARASVDVTLTPESGDWVDHHLWAVQTAVQTR